MASVAHSFMKIFRGSSAGPGQVPSPPQTTKRLSRRSSGLAELGKSFASEEPLCVLDLGSTSAANIRYLTGRGHKIYSEDLLVASTDPSLPIKDDAGNPVLDSNRFLADNLA
jgi:hypothetical protein